MDAVRKRVQRSAGILSFVVERSCGWRARSRTNASRLSSSAADSLHRWQPHEGSGIRLMGRGHAAPCRVARNIPTFRLRTGKGTVGTRWTPGEPGLARARWADAGRRDLDASGRG